MNQKTPEAVLRFGHAVAAALVLGALTVAGFAPFYFYSLAIITIAAFSVVLTSARTAWQAASLGFSFGLGLLLTGASWVYVSMHDYGSMPAPVAAFSTLLFCVIYATCPALAAAAIHRFRAPVAWQLLLVFPALWSLADWVRGWLFTGFPWLVLGYSQVPGSPLAGYGPILGVYGVSLATAVVGGSIALVLLRLIQAWNAADTRKIMSAVAVPAAVAVTLLLGGAGLARIEWTQHAGDGPITVSLVQGNIPQDLKWRPDKARETLVAYLDLVRVSPGKLIVLPETALPMFDINLPPGYLDKLAEHTRSQGGDLLTGIPEYAAKGEYYNSVISVGTSPSQTYRKVHLVPFGDYFPMRWAIGWLMNSLDIPMSDFSRGAEDQRPLAVAGQKVAVNICYEDVFGEEIIRQLPEATMLANFTNDAWWGRSLASNQHLQMAQMRSIETGRSMLRATNTGVTAVIDHRGALQGAAPEFQHTVLTTEVWGRSGTTPYVRWGNNAYLAVVAVFLAAAFVLARSAKR